MTSLWVDNTLLAIPWRAYKLFRVSGAALRRPWEAFL